MLCDAETPTSRVMGSSVKDPQLEDWFQHHPKLFGVGWLTGETHVSAQKGSKAVRGLTSSPALSGPAAEPASPQRGAMRNMI